MSTFGTITKILEPDHLAAKVEQERRGREKYLPGDRVLAKRLTNPGPGTVICTHTASHYVAVTIQMDSGERAVVDASRVEPHGSPKPKCTKGRKVLPYRGPADEEGDVAT